jgi:lysophospholipase L1-like esterase
MAAVAGPSSAGTPVIGSHLYQIYPLGDSITVGGSGLYRSLGYKANHTPGGYRGPLNDLLTDAGIWHRFVGTSHENAAPGMWMHQQQWHDGHGGYRIDEVTRDLAGVAGGNSDDGGHWLTGVPNEHAAIYPNIVIIHLGTNDIYQDYDPARLYPTASGQANLRDPSQRNQFVADMTIRLGQLVDTIYQLRPAARIVLSDIVPMATVLCDPVTGEYARSIQMLVGQRQSSGRAIVLADVWGAFTARGGGVTTTLPGLMSDDTHHPTASGYHVMSRVYLDAIQRLI